MDIKNKKKSKYLYKKVLRWKKEPKYDGLVGGFIFCLFSFLMLCLLFFQDRQTALLTLVSSIMFAFGAKLMIKSAGEGKREYYTKTRWRK